MTRVKQFADDLGISKNKAQALINKGRSRKDGGSQILEKVMKKPIYAKNGKITKINKGDSGKAKVAQFKNIQNASAAGKISSGEAERKIRELVLSKKDGGTFKDITGDGKITQKDVLKARGVPGFSRGGGMAIQGLGFTGVK